MVAIARIFHHEGSRWRTVACVDVILSTPECRSGHLPQKLPHKRSRFQRRFEVAAVDGPARLPSTATRSGSGPLLAGRRFPLFLPLCPHPRPPPAKGGIL